MNAIPTSRMDKQGIRHLALHFAESVNLDLAADTLHAIHASGRGSRLSLPADWLVVCAPISGCLQLQSRAGQWSLPTMCMQVWRDAPLRIDCPSSGAWIGLAGPLRAWEQHVQPAYGRVAAPCIFPRQRDFPRPLRHLLVRLVRVARGGHAATTADPAMLVDALYAALLDHQRDLDEYLQRCSGRTLQRRQQTLLRLLRVRHLIEIHDEGRPDVAMLARSANYSPWHLMRMHRDVFGQTPSEYASQLRLQRAWSLVSGTQLPICEITEALGFESQSSFCRAFKNAYGTTAGQARQCGGPPAYRSRAA